MSRKYTQLTMKKIKEKERYKIINRKHHNIRMKLKDRANS
jgi:hypothetical protein